MTRTPVHQYGTTQDQYTNTDTNHGKASPRSTITRLVGIPASERGSEKSPLESSLRVLGAHGIKNSQAYRPFDGVPRGRRYDLDRLDDYNEIGIKLSKYAVEDLFTPPCYGYPSPKQLLRLGPSHMAKNRQGKSTPGLKHRANRFPPLRNRKGTKHRKGRSSMPSLMYAV